MLARHYRRSGTTPSAQRIIDFAASIGLDGASVLEIGGGIGEIQLELLRRGAARTMNMELSGGYEAEATRLLDEAGLRHRTTRIVGIDIAVTPEAAEPADIVVLHRVVCCYPDYGRLLAAAAQHARRALVFSHPPSTALTRTFVALANLFHRLIGREYRSFVHSPAEMVNVLERHGMRPRSRYRDGMWCVVGAVRDGAT